MRIGRYARKLALPAGGFLVGVAVALAASQIQHRSRPAPLDIHSAKAAVHQGITAHADVVLLGDSLTHWGEWSELLPGVRVANRGVAGDLIAQVRERVGTVDQVTPGVVVLTVGTNDLWRGRPVAEAFRDYVALLDAMRGHGYRVIAVQVPRAGGQLQDAQEFNARVEQFNEQLRAACASRGTEVRSIDPDGPVDALRLSDGVHLNAEAYGRWAESLRGWLASRPARAAT